MRPQCGAPNSPEWSLTFEPSQVVVLLHPLPAELPAQPEQRHALPWQPSTLRRIPSCNVCTKVMHTYSGWGNVVDQLGLRLCITVCTLNLHARKPASQISCMHLGFTACIHVCITSNRNIAHEPEPHLHECTYVCVHERVCIDMHYTTPKEDAADEREPQLDLSITGHAHACIIRMHACMYAYNRHCLFHACYAHICMYVCIQSQRAAHLNRHVAGKPEEMQHQCVCANRMDARLHKCIRA